MRSARWIVAAAALVALAVAAPGAGGQETQALTFQHDGSRDGTPSEIHSGLFSGDPASGDPISTRYPDTYETFPLTVPEGTRHGSLRATIDWGDPRIDLGVSIYRLNSPGRTVNPVVARPRTART